MIVSQFKKEVFISVPFPTGVDVLMLRISSARNKNIPNLYEKSPTAPSD